MQLEDYFDFLASNDIRLKGHRIGIETILFHYLDGMTAEEIALRYPTLSMEEVYATSRTNTFNIRSFRDPLWPVMARCGPLWPMFHRLFRAKSGTMLNLLVREV